MRKNNAQEYPVHVLRERLRQCALSCTQTLSRSVGRLTSCDALPCLEYHHEVEHEYAVIDKLIYLQRCRSALGRCISSGSFRLRYRWRDGRVSDTCFRKTSPWRVRVSGLTADAVVPAAG